MFRSEVVLHQQLSTHEVRTLNPLTADYFLLPVYSTCKKMPEPIFGPDAFHGRLIITEAIKFVKDNYPYYHKNGGEHQRSTEIDKEREGET